ncbi:tRNA preQ1(34) S-adenosylmethionine ribosyltransferase-isomerase QueA [Clostridium aminobutyricum]|uniref:S-adenosylmethionine:tRNA ribosyltransferase-isomerase n=1 Tax=Clostridium aminobutyricum TaxID=33953 RepID=A0A939D6Y8_CLOAM|nr:tRNA preQ1(34) S-adenosylmethionine ribosyltransferase-isomerase QueA [Clostridium aminobutyricum]MBN7772659.1 tRNA preQ1(34) S-adenosylmethionine ribosyltransferase-isomerase QueA [Clostridium aminobutyricum]
MHITDFDYNLPSELIAQKPTDKRDNSKLLVVHRDTGELEHKHFYNILEYLKPGDCLVLNNSKVLPARLFGTKVGTGAKVEFLLIKRLEGDIWETMVRPGKRLKPGDVVDFATEATAKFQAVVVNYGEEGTRHVRFEYDGIFLERLEELGSMPLPPYIERASEEDDKNRYQTVYCKEEGSVAAPTAGLHFTDELLEKARAMGVQLAYVTLHVGIGTFRPVKCETIEEHKMHFEEYHIDEENARIINETKASGHRVICVGTTSCRTIESAAVKAAEGSSATYELKAGEGSTGIFIYPGYEFKIVDSLITNFHLPKSTLLMLISALYDREKILKVYATAVEEKYRFFSYGDAMLII